MACSFCVFCRDALHRVRLLVPIHGPDAMKRVPTIHRITGSYTLFLLEAAEGEAVPGILVGRDAVSIRVGKDEGAAKGTVERWGDDGCSGGLQSGVEFIDIIADDPERDAAKLRTCKLIKSGPRSFAMCFLPFCSAIFTMCLIARVYIVLVTTVCQ